MFLELYIYNHPIFLRRVAVIDQKFYAISAFT